MKREMVPDQKHKPTIYFSEKYNLKVLEYTLLRQQTRKIIQLLKNI